MIPGTNFGAALTSTLQIHLKNGSDLALFATCTGGVPPATANVFAPGAVCMRVDSSGGVATFINTGTAAAPVWTPIGGGAALAAGSIVSAVIAGGSAGDLTVTGVEVGDELVAVVRLNRDATAANINISSLLSEFSITATDTVNNVGGTDTSGDALFFLYIDKTP